MKFVNDFQAWIKGDKTAGYEKHRKDAIRDGAPPDYRIYIPITI